MKDVDTSVSLLTKALKTHLNLGQQLLVNASSVFMSVETLSAQLMFAKDIPLIGDALLRLPSTFNPSLKPNESYLLRVR